MCAANGGNLGVVDALVGAIIDAADAKVSELACQFVYSSVRVIVCREGQH
jgi:hypothetical protein